MQDNFKDRQQLKGKYKLSYYQLNVVVHGHHFRFYCTIMHPLAQCCPTRGPRAACGPPVLGKFVRNNIMRKKSSKRQNLTLHLTISTQMKFWKFIKYTVLNPQIRENVM